jgi:hypothetical protein
MLDKSFAGDLYTHEMCSSVKHVLYLLVGERLSSSNAGGECLSPYN